MQNISGTSWLFELIASFRKELRIYLRYPVLVLSGFIRVPLTFIFFALAIVVYTPPSTSPAAEEAVFNYFFWGFVLLILFSTCISGIGESVETERQEGTLEQQFLAPVSSVTLIFGRWARNIITDALTISWAALSLYLWTGLFPVASNPLILFVGLILLETALLGFGMGIAAATFLVRSYGTLTTFTWTGLVLFCGIFFPPSSLPGPFYDVSLVIPFTYYADLIHAATSGRGFLLNQQLELGFSLVFSFLLFGAGLVLFRAVERRVRRHGHIELE